MEKLKHLTAVRDKNTGEITSYALYISIPTKRAEKVSDALNIKLNKGDNKSAFVCNCIESGVQEPVCKQRVENALKLLDDYGPIYTRTHDEQAIIMDMRMILTGCNVEQMLNLTGEKSQEYIERYGDDY